MFIRKYLSDPTEDVKVATEGVLADFLHEIQEITLLQKRKEDKARAAREAASVIVDKPDDAKAALAPEAENEQLGRGAFMPDGDSKLTVDTTNQRAAPEVEAPHDSGGASFYR
jgi:vacuole morphology and inheritance protein 14